MGIRQLAIAAVLGAAALMSASALAQEMVTPTMKFFVAIPIGARNAKEQQANFGLQFQGSRPYQNVTIDYRTLRQLPAAEGLDMKHIVARAIAQQFEQQRQQQQEACPTPLC